MKKSKFFKDSKRQGNYQKPRLLIRKSVVARAVLSVRSMHPADGECPVFTLRRGGLTIVQKAPGHKREKMS
jgi:hypothetical protein